MRYSIETRNRILLKSYGFLPFAKSMGKISINLDISKNLNGKYRQNLHDDAKNSATDAIKTDFKKAVQKTAEASGDLIGNKISDKSTKASKSSSQNTSETVESETEIHKEIYKSPERRQKTIDD